MNNLTPDEFQVWAAAFAVQQGRVCPWLEANEAVEAYRQLPDKPVVERICEDHECDLCDQAQKLMEAMNDKCVRVERVLEEVQALCPNEPPPHNSSIRHLWVSMRAYNAACIALEAREHAEEQWES